jgi:hypothetical protein
MSFLKTAVTTAFGLALLGAVFSPSAKADEWDKKTTINFSGPVEIPGAHIQGWRVLPAGTYVFRVLRSAANRHIVQIFNQEESKIYATILAIPNYRLQPTDKTAVTFRERPAGEPPALRAWFYPGKSFGEEFVYGRTQAIELAKATNTVVLSTSSELPEETAEETSTVSEPEVAQLIEAPVAATQPTGEEVEMAMAVTAPPSAEIQPDTAPAQVAEMLPRTASPLPLIGLLGLLALGGAWAIGLVQKRVM